MQFETDKYKNGLIVEYDAIFRYLKDQPLKILEVGVLKGGFLLWLADYFPKASIYGADILSPNLPDHPRIKFEVCDQNDSVALRKLGGQGPFDIIIDDGSHRKDETKNTFENLIESVNPGGLYIIEDFIAGYWPEFPAYDGINNFVFAIAAAKNTFGISDFKIILKEPKCSIAIFKKK